MALTDLSDYISFTFEIANDSLCEGEIIKRYERKLLTKKENTMPRQSNYEQIC